VRADGGRGLLHPLVSYPPQRSDVMRSGDRLRSSCARLLPPLLPNWLEEPLREAPRGIAPVGERRPRGGEEPAGEPTEEQPTGVTFFFL
jgi:hypothetical protein